MAKNKNESADDLLGDIKPKAKKAVVAVKPVAKAAVVAAKPVAKAAVVAAKPVAKAVKAERAPRTTVSDTMKLKTGSATARPGTMFAKVADAFGAGTTVKTAIERLKKTLKQPRGSSMGENTQVFILGYIRGAMNKGLIVSC